EEVLEWMHLAIGTNADSTVSIDSKKSIGAVLDALRELKSDLEWSKRDVDRYKRELESTTATLNSKGTELEWTTLKLNIETEESAAAKEMLKNKLEVERKKVR
ncbi:hypothetical protein PFISCL1PPCAC_20286, partial [Pristionchus fissidentatus]